MKRVIVMIAGVALVSGCAWIAPDVSKALSEEKQNKVQTRQAVALERIATALEGIEALSRLGVAE